MMQKSPGQTLQVLDMTDNWVNILTTRTVGVQNGYVVFYDSDMGYDSVSTSPLVTTAHSSSNMGDT